MRTRAAQSWRSRALRVVRPRGRDRALGRLTIELLEGRWLKSVTAVGSSLVEVQPNETIDQVYDLGTLGQPAEVGGSIGNGPAGAADVTWYEFELGDASRVDLNVGTPAGSPPFASVLSLFNNDPDDWGDPYDLDGHRLLAQVEATAQSGALAYSQDLAPGVYFVAISGAGNLDFSPVVAGSGFDGATGNYALSISATDLDLSGDGPTVVSSDPAAGTVLASSPLAIRLEMSGPLDPSTIVAGQTVQLEFSPLGTGAPGAGTPVALASVNFSTAADELQLFPLGPLAPGQYTVTLAGNSIGGRSVLASPDGVPLGEDAAYPAGIDESLSFEVDGIDGIAGATGSDDTAPTAHQLGDVAGAGLVQVDGAIGVDPFFNPSLATDPSEPEAQSVPANQVDLYHFEITGPGRYAMLAEVFAGRIGSPLQPGVSLYERDPQTGLLVFVGGELSTQNPTQGTDGSVPLFTDSELTAGLTAGDYYLAVGDAGNMAAPIDNQAPGSPGIFDPNQPGSAQNGWNTGPYVLNILVQAAPEAPRVIASSPASNQVLVAAPTELTVQFSEPMNIQQLAFQAFAMTDQETLPEVYVEAADGTKYYPRFLSYDGVTNVATFQMLDDLANGSYGLYLSGWAGLTDLGGNPLAGNDLSEDYVIPFAVNGPARDIFGNMANGYTVAAQAGDQVAQDLGTLFPDELQAGVTIIRMPQTGTSTASTSTADEYSIQLLQNQEYSFALDADTMPEGAAVTLTDAAGQSVPLLQSFDGQVYFAPLAAGTYTVAVGGWTSGQSASVSYQLTIKLDGQDDNAPPLVDGPAPAIQIQLDNTSGPAVSAPTGSSGGAAGTSTVLLAVPSGLSVAPIEYAGAMGSLGASPLGGASAEASAAAAPPIQVALTSAPPPGYGGLVSLLTSIYVLPSSGAGEELGAVGPGEQPVNEAIAETVPVPTGRAAVSSSLPNALFASGPRFADSEAVRLPAPATNSAEPGVQSIVPAAVDRQARSRAATALAGLDEIGAADRVLMRRLAVAGGIVATALWGRRAIRDLNWKKRLSPAQPSSTGPHCRKGSQGSTTVVWQRSGQGHAVHRGGHGLEAAGGPCSREAR